MSETFTARRLALTKQTFAALAIPNFRRYFTGQAISLSGTWMQSVAQSWLIFKLTELRYGRRLGGRVANPAGLATRPLRRGGRRPRSTSAS